MQYNCTNCHAHIATISGSNVTICGDATIAGNFPPTNPHSNWLKCSKCNAWARSGGNSGLAQQLEQERRQREQERIAQERALAAARQQREEARRRAEQQQRQQTIQTLRTQFSAYNSNLGDLQRQVSRKQNDERREEKAQEALAQQLDAERSVVSKFSLERTNNDVARIVLLGQTGMGKSTLANRLVGDASQFCDTTSAVFRVNNGIHSETKDIQKETKQVRLENGETVTICVIDTPGLNDSDGQDRHHVNLLCEYLRGIERVHSFVLVLSVANPRVDEDTMAGLEKMMAMFGRNFWAFTCVVVTNVDDDHSRARLGANRADIQEKIRTKFGLSAAAAPLPIFGIGFADWQVSMSNIVGHGSTHKFYTCDKLQSPLATLEANLQAQLRKTQKIKNEVRSLNTRISQVQSNVQSVRSSLRGYGVTV